MFDIYCESRRQRLCETCSRIWKEGVAKGAGWGVGGRSTNNNTVHSSTMNCTVLMEPCSCVARLDGWLVGWLESISVGNMRGHRRGGGISLLEIHICRKHQDEISYIITHKMVSIMKQQIYSILLRRCVETVVDLFDIFVWGYMVGLFWYLGRTWYLINVGVDWARLFIWLAALDKKTNVYLISSTRAGLLAENLEERGIVWTGGWELLENNLICLIRRLFWLLTIH